MNTVVLDHVQWELVDSGSQALLVDWLVAEGDLVEAGQPLASVDLGHTTLEVPAAHTGTLEDILVAAGETFSRGQPLARLIAT